MWNDGIDDILGGDLTAAVGMPTAAGGVVLATIAPLGMRDRQQCTVSFTTSLGFGRKLERIHADPRIAVAYHTRQHGKTERPGYVLVQGQATIRTPRDDERDDLRARATDHLGAPRTGRFWDWWLRAYYDDRVIVDVAVDRITAWPDDACVGVADVVGDAPASGQAPTQPEPRDATRARVPVRRVMRSIERDPYVLLGVLDADGVPEIVPVAGAVRDGDSVVVRSPVPLPSGGHRAGLLAHAFQPEVVGLRTATHTGWLVVDGETATWTPHTRRTISIPANKTVVLLGNGGAARAGLRKAVRDGLPERLGLTSEAPTPSPG